MQRLHNYAQHFLRSPQLVAELIGHSTIKKSDVVYDIGAGSGIITAVLASRCKAVVAIESEPITARKLRENVAGLDNVTIVEADFMTVSLPDGPYKVFANIPFNLSSVIVRRLTRAKVPPHAISLIVQKQFANKLLPDSDRFSGQLGMLIGPWFDVRIRKRLQRTDYWPHPNVDTVMVELLPRPKPLIEAKDRQRYEQMIERCFENVTAFRKLPLAHIGLSQQARPSQLTVMQWVELFAKK